MCSGRYTRFRIVQTLLADLAGTGNWLEGKRLDRGISEDEVKDWVESLNLN